MWKRFIIITTVFLILILVLASSCAPVEATKLIDLSGTWDFKIDSLDAGITENWFKKDFNDTIVLPGSMAENNKGNNVTVETKWTGEILDSSYYFDKKYAKFREPGNIKIPFWLQPKKHYIGASWYHKKIKIPKSWTGKGVSLFLERPHWETQVWWDGNLIGKQNFLATPHQYVIYKVQPGTHSISIRIDNRIKEIDPGESSHSITDNTQTNWNGIVGEMYLKVLPDISVKKIKVVPDANQKKVKAYISFQNNLGTPAHVSVKVSISSNSGQVEKEIPFEKNVTIADEEEIVMEYKMREEPLLWDEFDPNLYTLQVDVKNEEKGKYKDLKKVAFGFKDFSVRGKQFTINGRPIFLRGTLECAIFPLTGYPPTEIGEWKRIFNIIKSHGLNHMRFHSWCPPKAAFTAADELGIYLQVEASSWANSETSKLGNGDPIDNWIYKETQAILDTYGNHPSLCLMAYGNEPGGAKKDDYLQDYVSHFKKKEPRVLFTGGAGWPLNSNADFYDHAGPRLQHWGAGLQSTINANPPETQTDYKDLIDKTPMPYVSHEMGQWCVYPNFKEMSKYTGILQPKNFEIFKETLTENGLLPLADSLVLASGKLQALCYKADIEKALRTKDMAGFQLLDLHDFPGQGTALVGVLDAFWDEKGYISPEEYREFCNKTVPLIRLKKRTFLSNETVVTSAEVAHFGKEIIQGCQPTWEVTNAAGDILFKGAFPVKDIQIGNAITLGTISFNLEKISKAQKLAIKVTVNNHSNSWDIWVYPHKKERLEKPGSTKIISKLTKEVFNYINNGGNVLLTIKKGDITPQKGGNIGVGFSSIFWNTAYTSGQKPHTLGILCNPQHAAFKFFPTEYHSNWQWWDAMSHSNAMVLDDFPENLHPIIRIIDDWFENRRTALLFEGKIGKGKILVSGIDLLTDLEFRLEARELLYSLKKYMESPDFSPKTELNPNILKALFIDNQ